MIELFITVSIVVSIIAVVCVSHHCWKGQTGDGTCPFCHCKLDHPSECDECGASRVAFKL